MLRTAQKRRDYCGLRKKRRGGRGRDAEAEMTDAEVAECRGMTEVRCAEPRCRAEVPSLRNRESAEGRSLNKSRDVKSHVTVVTKVTVMKDPIT